MEADRRRWLGLLAGLGLLLISCGPNAQAVTTLRARWDPWTCDETTGQIISLSVPSATYGRPVLASVYVPACYDWTPGKLPVIYLLHGGNADETQWPDLRLATEADAMIAAGAPPFVVVMPGGVYSLDVDYAAFVLTDLLPGIESRLRVRASGSGRAIGGISLGGYWALKLAFQHPNLFAAVGGHSPVIARGGADDPAALAQTAAGLAGLPIRLDAGDLDSLRASAEQLAGALQARGLAVTVTISPGGHNRPYWRSHTAEYLRFYLAALAPTTQPPQSHPPNRRACNFGEAE